MIKPRVLYAVVVKGHSGREWIWGSYHNGRNLAIQEWRKDQISYGTGHQEAVKDWNRRQARKELRVATFSITEIPPIVKQRGFIC